MNPAHRLRFLCMVLCALLSAGCAGHGSSARFDSLGKSLKLVAFDEAARAGTLSGPSSAAWFGFDPARAGLAGKTAIGRPVTLEIVVRPERGGAKKGGKQDAAAETAKWSLSLGVVTASDVGKDGKLVDAPAPRPLAVLSGLDPALGEARLGIVLPRGSDARGFAVSVSGGASFRARIVRASIIPAETGWSRDKDSFCARFSSPGGEVSPDTARDAAWEMPLRSCATVRLAANPAGVGTPENQDKIAFASGDHSFGFRKSPKPAVVRVPSFIAEDSASCVRAVSGSEGLDGFTVEWWKEIPAAKPADPLSPVAADPHMIIEWPQSAWRRADREVFVWDRFPTVLVFDTADYATLDRYFKRLAFFVEKKGWRGKLWTDADMAGQHAYYAHDYRADGLAEFFSRAEKERFPLGKDELELRGLLLAEGVILKDGGSFKPGAGAVIAISRESAPYLRYLFMAHEAYHGIYFVDPDFRARVADAYRSADPREIAFLKSYFTLLDTLGYDVTDEYLMENEFMAYLMQLPLNRVAAYYAGNIADRFRAHGGDRALDKWVMATKGESFAKSAAELNDYVFGRWGIAGGRVGLFWSDR